MSFLDNLKKKVKSRNDLTNETRKSASWFRQKIKELGGKYRNQLSRTTAEKFYKSRDKVAGPRLFKMYSYFYDPKTKDKLKYYDKFPLVLVMKIRPDGFEGINFHYLPPKLRARLMDEILEGHADKNGNIKLRYQTAKNLRGSKILGHCYKRYLYSHVRSKFVRISGDELNVAIFLPTEKFVKASKNEVWGDA